MKPVRKVLSVPANPGRQGAVLVVLVHGGEMPPLRIAAQQFDGARLEINPKPLPLQQEQAGARGWNGRAHPWTKSRRRKEQGNESSFQQHPVRLISGKILRRADK